MAVEKIQLDNELAHAAAKGGAFLFSPVGERRVFCPELFSEEQRSFYKTALEFAMKRVLPQSEAIEAKRPGVLPGLLKEAGGLGILMVDIPEAYGGLSGDIVTSALVAESQAVQGSWTVSFGAHVSIGTLPIVFFGTDAQKKKFLPKSATGEWLFAYALSEAGSGSDALGAKTRADLSPDGKHYILNGSKQWITNAGFADVFTVFAKVSGDRFTAFIVEKGTLGFSVGREEHKLGLRGSSTCPLIFEDARVPVENVLGEVGKGHKIAFNILNMGRFKLSVGSAGAMKNTLGLGAKYALDRKAFGHPISDFALVREKLARGAATAYAAESMGYRVAGSIEEALAHVSDGSKNHAFDMMRALEAFAVECSICKVMSSEALHNLSDEVLQIHGGYGYVEDFPIERVFRDQRVNRIYEGTNEINRMLIPGMILKRAMKGELPLMEAAANLDEEIADPARLLPNAQGRLVPERRLTEGVKRSFLLAARAAVAKFGTAIDERQEVLAALADIAIDAYALDSMIARTLQRNGDPQAGLRDALCRFFAAEARDRVHKRTRDALAGSLAGDELSGALRGLDVLLPYVPQDPAALREAIVPAVLEASGYPFSY